MASVAASGMKIPAPLGARRARPDVGADATSAGASDSSDRVNICRRLRFICIGPIECTIIANLGARNTAIRAVVAHGYRRLQLESGSIQAATSLCEHRRF